MRYIIAAIVALCLGISQNARTAVRTAGSSVWLIARGVVEWCLTQGKWYLRATAYAGLVLLPLFALGFWLPAAKLVFLVLSIIWFGLLILVLRVIAGALRGVPELDINGKKIPLDAGLGDALADALTLGIKPFLFVLILLGCWSLQVLAFPGVGSTIGLFGLLALLTWKATDAYKGKPMTMQIAYVWVAVCIAMFAVGRIFPSANDWLNAVVKGGDRKVASSASGKSVRNEPFARFTANRYVWQLGLTDKTAVPIFDKDGQPVSDKTKLLGEIDEKLVILLNPKQKTPKAAELAGIEFAKIQSPVDLQQYIVPRRCVDTEAKDAMSLEAARTHDAVYLQLKLGLEDLRKKATQQGSP